MKMKYWIAIISIGLILTWTVPALPALAHHSAGNFWYTDKNVTVKGVVKSVKIINPHPEMVIEVTEESGQKATWRITGGGNASGMIRAGWKNGTLPAGTQVTVEGHPSRTEGAKALLAGTVTTADGKVFNFSAGSGPVDQ
jgi:Family of unknown function (DUF6152)